MAYIFIHGLGQSEKSWDSIVSNFSKDKVHCPNLKQLLNNTEVNYQNLYQAFKEYCNGFHEPLHLCGLSLGGILALQYALEYPASVSSLTVIASPYKMPKNLMKIQNIIFHLMPKSTFKNMGFTKPEFISLTNSMKDLDFSNQLSLINCKALVICGEKDNANRKSMIALSQQLHNSKLVIIDHASHEVNIDNPDGLKLTLNHFYDTMI